MTDRPEWEQYFLDIAEAVSRRAPCTRRQVGAVLTIDKRIVATGYNGAPPNAPHCTDGACPRGALTHEQLPAGTPGYNGGDGPLSCIAIHAERNAINHFALHHPDWSQQLTQARMYINSEPCPDCTDLMGSLNLAGWTWRWKDGVHRARPPRLVLL
jgi:dCMP deaminase